MWTVLLSLMLLPAQLTPGTPTQAPSPVRIEKLTPDEQKQLKEAKAEVADAQAKADAASKAQEANKTDATSITLAIAKGIGKRRRRAMRRWRWSRRIAS